MIHDVKYIEDLASSIVELITNYSLWREYSENAIKLASLFDVKKLVKLEANVIYST